MPAGTEVFVNKIPWDWGVHIRIDYLDTDDYLLTVYNAEIPEGIMNPVMDDFHQVIWLEDTYKNIDDIKAKLSFLRIDVPEDFFQDAILWKQHKKRKWNGTSKKTTTHTDQPCV